jgi:hypothetical protein
MSTRSTVRTDSCVLRDWYPFRRFSRSSREVREYLVGAIYGDPARADGTVIVTSAIRRRVRNVAVSESGARYVLDAKGFGSELQRLHT